MGCYDELPIHRSRGVSVTTGDIEYGNGTGGHAARWHGYCNGATGFYSPGAADQDDYWTNHTAETCDVSDWTLPDESGNGLSNLRGTIAMARTSEPHSANAQFFINTKDNRSLNPKSGRWGYAVFGTVIEGMEIVDKISKKPTGPKGRFTSDVPIETVLIMNISIE